MTREGITSEDYEEFGKKIMKKNARKSIFVVSLEFTDLRLATAATEGRTMRRRAPKYLRERFLEGEITAD
jgi:hypothetical protein